jgi:hypothetical protein
MPARLTLDSAALERLFALWNVPLPAKGLVIFALRGALPQGPQAATRGWARTAALRLVTPDHLHMRCTIGLWDRTGKRLFVAPGSTVPHRDNVLKAAARKGVMKGRGTNQLEPGYYTDLTKGEHLQGKPQGHAALRQTGFRFYRRAHLAGTASGHKLPLYTARDPLYFGNPYDNLHCAWNPDPLTEGFRSAGCVVVSGWPHSPRLPDAKPRPNKNAGAWKIFHDLVYAAPQKTFPLLLLPAEDAAAALNAKNPVPHMVFGSEGEAVKTLQKKLAAKGLFGGRITGRLGVSTYRAWKGRGEGLKATR